MTTLAERRKTRKSTPDRVQKEPRAGSRSQIESRVLVFIIGCIIGLILFVIGYFRSSLYQPLRLSSGWDGESQFALLLIQPKQTTEAQYSMFVLILQNSAQSAPVYVLPLPDELMIEAVGGYGMYPSQAVAGLYELEKKSDLWAVESVRLATGIDIRGSLRVPANYTELNAGELQDIGTQQLLYQVSASLPPVDRVRFWLRTRGVSQALLERVDLHSSFVTRPEDQMILNASAFDRFVEQKIAPVVIRNERVSLAVLNASQASGVATRFGRAYANMGLNLARVDTLTDSERGRITREDVLKSLEKGESILILRSADLDQSRSVQVLRRTFFPDGLRIVIDPELAQVFRADTVLLVATPG